MRARTICVQCSLGCGLYLSGDREVEKIEYDREHPFNQGRLCAKGNLSHMLLYRRRIFHPLRKVDGELKKIGWDEAFDLIRRKIDEVGDVTVATSGCTTNEENEKISSLARALDAKFCVPEIGTLQKPDLQALLNSKYMITIGNPFEQNPVISRYILRAKRRGGKLTVIDRRRGQTARFADNFICIPPESEGILLSSVISKKVRHGMIGELASRAGYAGISDPIVECLAKELEEEQKFLIYTTDRISGCLPILELFIETFGFGNNVVPIYGAPNARGAVERGAGLLDGCNGMLIMFGGIPYNFKPDAKFVVASQPFLVDGCMNADVILPSSYWIEKDGTFTAFDGRAEKIGKHTDPPSGVPSDGEIADKLASKLGVKLEGGYVGGEKKITQQIPHPTEEFPLIVFGERRGFTAEHEIVLELLEEIAGIPRSFAEINADDAREMGIKNGDEIEVETQRGKVITRAVVSDEVRRGTIFISDHKTCVGRIHAGVLRR